MKIKVSNTRHDDFFIVEDTDKKRLICKIIEGVLNRNWEDEDCHIQEVES